MDEKFDIIASYDLTSLLIGFYVINENHLLVIEELFFRVIGRDGVPIQEESLDFFEDYTLTNNILTLKTERGEKQYDFNAIGA